MKILYYSVVPWMHTGYATCTEEIATRLHNGEHEVAIQCLSAISDKKIIWHGEGSDCELDEPMTIYPSDSAFGLDDAKEAFMDFNADVMFTHFDTWLNPARKKIPNYGVPYSSYAIVDHDPAPEYVVEQLAGGVRNVSMSEFGKERLDDKGERTVQIPHGVDTGEYYPLDESDKPTVLEIRDNDGDVTELNIDRHFIFGMVAANHGSRKNIPAHMHAFKIFLEKVDDNAIIMIHTEQNSHNGYNLREVQNELDIPDSNLIWPRGEDYGEVGNEYLNSLYNSFDVFLNCSYGESWGLTVTEAQAAGTPVIASNFTALPEQLGVSQPDKENIEKVDEDVYRAPHGLVCDPSAPVWKQKVNSRQYIVPPSTIFRAMKYYYNNKEEIIADGVRASEYVSENYDWDDVVIPQFEDHFAELEELLT